MLWLFILLQNKTVQLCLMAQSYSYLIIMFGCHGLGIYEAEIIGAEVMMGARNMAFGMGMRGVGYCPPGCISTCCRRVILCPPGCMNSCCLNQTRLCAPGCTLPCCQPMILNTNPTSRYAPMGQNAYTPNRLLPQQQMLAQKQMGIQQMNPQPQMVPQQMNPRQQQMRMNPQQQILAQQQVRMNPQMNPRQQLMVPSQPIIGQKQENFVTVDGCAQSQIPYMNDIERTKQQQLAQQKNQIQSKQQLNSVTINAQGNLSKQSAQVINYKQGQRGQNIVQNSVDNNILFQGEAYERIGARWQYLCATLTSQHFISLPLKAIDKIKIKAESQMNGTRIIKICSGTNEFFYSVPAQQQLQWMLNLFYQKLVVMGCTPSTGQQQNSCAEGPILKKSFFGGWEHMFGTLTSQMFKISKTMGGLAEKSITSVREIWSRFEIVEGTMMVIKMHWMGSKIEVAVPIEIVLVWLRGLFNLIR